LLEVDILADAEPYSILDFRSLTQEINEKHISNIIEILVRLIILFDFNF
jgi:hypothetical protein